MVQFDQQSAGRISTSVRRTERQTRNMRSRRGRWGSPRGGRLIRFCLAEDHPGRGIVFEVYLGVWNSATHSWSFDCSVTVKAIDWFNGGTHPDAGAQGWGVWKPSDEHGRILASVEIDCESPGPCCE